MTAQPNPPAAYPRYDASRANSRPDPPQTTGVRPERGKNSSNLRPKPKPANRVVRLRPVHGYSVTKHDDSAAILQKPCGDKLAKTKTGKKFVTRTRNLALSSLIEAVRDQTRIVDLKQVNHVLIQPRWRKDCDQPLP